MIRSWLNPDSILKTSFLQFFEHPGSRISKPWLTWFGLIRPNCLCCSTVNPKAYIYILKLTRENPLIGQK